MNHVICPVVNGGSGSEQISIHLLFYMGTPAELRMECPNHILFSSLAIQHTVDGKKPAPPKGWF